VKGRPPAPIKIARLKVGPAEQCDLGNVRLPQAGEPGLRFLEDSWLTRSSLSNVLQGEAPAEDEIVGRDSIYSEEPRLGIARDNSRRTNRDGFLYQSRHLRLEPDLLVEAGVSGVDLRLQQPNRLVRLGGEGRLTAVTVGDGKESLPDVPVPTPRTVGLILLLLTPADLEGRALPAAFEPVSEDGVRVWRGEIAGIPLTIESAVLGGAVREGGWDLARRAPRAVRSLVPAGSAWYCTVRDRIPLAQAIEALHGARIGDDQALGRGQLAAGLWDENEFTKTEVAQR
jgi:CRISPR-associated protein Cmr3